MAIDRTCPHCDGAKEKFGESCWWCEGTGRVVQPDIVLTVPTRSLPPPPCPACEAAARCDACKKELSTVEKLPLCFDCRPNLGGPCPACASTQRELAEALRSASEWREHYERLIQALVDLTASGQERGFKRFVPGATIDLESLAHDEKAVAWPPHGWVVVREQAAGGTRTDDLRARLESLCVEMENDDRAGKLAHWIGAIRALLAEKEAK